jgi:hypothetical protein
MKKLALFGAGNAGKEVFSAVGKENVRCFIDNNPRADTLLDVPCLTFDEYLKIKDETIVIVASYDYVTEMCNQLEKNMIFDYRIYHRHSTNVIYTYRPYYYSIKTNQWLYYSYFELIKNYDLAKQQNITLYSYPENIETLMCVFEMAGIADKIKRIIPHTTIGIEKSLWSDVEANSDCVILAVRRNNSHLHDIIELNCEKYDSGNLAVADFYNFYKFIEEFHCPEMEKFKGIHKGKRVFLIGNGPSLTTSDLDLLHKNNEICFGCNKIYKIFDKTEWRPDYYFASDKMMLEEFSEDIETMDVPFKFLERHRISYFNKSASENNNIIFPTMNYEEYYPRYPGISEDAGKILMWLYSVVSEMMFQTALYMGFSEMYLLGIDNNSGIEKTVKHFYDNDLGETEFGEFVINTMNSPPKANKAFEKIRLYSDKHGIKVYNATRGGYLEAFERANLDSLFSDIN